MVGWFVNPAFLTADNFEIVVRAASLIGIAALGSTFITISGNFFSLSIQETAAICAITFALNMAAGRGLVLSLLITLLLGLVLGLIQGGAVALGANAIVTTLGGAAVIYGVAAIISGLKMIRVVDNGGAWIGSARPLGVPTESWSVILFTIIAAVVLNRTRFGRLIMLCGSNRKAAVASGLPVGLATISAFAIASVTAAVCGIFVATQFSLATIDQFDNMDFNMSVVAAVVVGGTAIQGGDGSALRTLIGAIFMALLDNLLVLSGQPQGVRYLVIGMLILVGVGGFHLLRQRSE
ncbi:MAG: ABC transporter permease [Chloroflexi bacterium]|nr:ABC transporter permease [Chloroflexota bacterium]